MPAQRARLPRAERREHFLDAAASLILARGLEAVTMEAIAAEAGVSKGLGYAYFANRGDLLRALLDRELELLEARTLERLDGVESFEARVRAATAAWFDTLAERGALLGALLRESRIDPGFDERRDRYNRRIEELYGGLAAKEFGIPMDQAVAAAAILLSGLNGMIGRWRSAGDPRPLLEETYVTVVMGAVRALAEQA